MNSITSEDDYLMNENPLLPSTSKATVNKAIKIEIEHPTEYLNEYVCLF